MSNDEYVQKNPTFLFRGLLQLFTVESQGPSQHMLNKIFVTPQRDPTNESKAYINNYHI